MTIDTFSSAEPAWVNAPGSHGGSDSITQLSSVRIRRNIEGFPFPSKCAKSELFDSAAIALGTIGRSPSWDESDFRLIDNLDDMSRYLLLEMKLITPHFLRGGPGRFLLRDSFGTAACMINEDDHISISVTLPGLDLFSAQKSVTDMEASMDIKLVKDAVLGYLTSNPSYVGTGMTATVMCHLPALDATDDITRVIDTFKRDWNNLELSRLTSYENESFGSFYILSNRITLSVSPEEIVRNVSHAAQTLVSRELFARHKVRNMREKDMIDRFWRTWGLLRHANKLSFSEAVDAFSFVKLGSDIGILPRIDSREWRRLVIGSQRYHLSLNSPVILDKSEEPFARAAIFRQYIEGLSSSVQ
jgi:protein arginine kinase